jgi:hypothetical protein
VKLFAVIWPSFQSLKPSNIFPTRNKTPSKFLKFDPTRIKISSEFLFLLQSRAVTMKSFETIKPLQKWTFSVVCRETWNGTWIGSRRVSSAKLKKI